MSSSSSGGMVLNPSYFGMTGHHNTMIHEMGHIFGLYHVFKGVSERDSCDDPCQVGPKQLFIHGSSSVSLNVNWCHYVSAVWIYRRPLHPWRRETCALTLPRPPNPKPVMTPEPSAIRAGSPPTRTRLIATTWVTQVQRITLTLFALPRLMLKLLKDWDEFSFNQMTTAPTISLRTKWPGCTAILTWSTRSGWWTESLPLSQWLLSWLTRVQVPSRSTGSLLWGGRFMKGMQCIYFFKEHTR